MSGETEEKRASEAAAGQAATPKPKALPKIEDATDVMFRNVVSTHVELTYIGDHKAYVMIYVNSLIIGALSTLMLPRLEANPLLMLPTGFTYLACLVSLIFSILAIRPSLGKGLTTREDVLNRKANILFFGNTYKMSLEDFEWSMHELLDKDETLVSNMIRDVFYLGKSLGEKYDSVRKSYTVFLYGMIVSVVTFLSAAAYLTYWE